MDENEKAKLITASKEAPQKQEVEATTASADEIVSTGEWLLIILVSFIPGINILVLLIWTCSSTNRNRINFGKAMLMIIAATSIISILVRVISAM